MIGVHLMGGLGNQIFQIVATIAYSIETNDIFAFVKNLQESYGVTIRHTYWNNFFILLKPYLVNELPPLKEVNECGFKYQVLPVTNNTKISGYFQSYKYFQKYEEDIFYLLGINLLKNNLLTKLNKKKEDFKNVISLHFRLGDYKHLTDFHNIMDVKYYIDSLSYIQSNKRIHTVYYFCEDEDIEIVQKKIDIIKQIHSYHFIRVTGLEDWEQLIYMSLCNHNIIANSSFSWWGAYFNEWNDKIVCRPSKWFNDPNIDTSDLCPTSWKTIQIT
jgi:hypothetical protein